MAYDYKIDKWYQSQEKKKEAVELLMDATGNSKPTIEGWCRGYRRPTVKALRVFCDITGLTINDVIEDIENGWGDF